MINKTIGKILVLEAGFGSTFPVTPYLSWDNGEVSGPYRNWKQAPLTIEHLLLAVETLTDKEKLAFVAAMTKDHKLARER